MNCFFFLKAHTVENGYDIALLRLATPVERKSGDPLRIACLPLMDVNMPEGSQCYVAGWGATRTHASTSATPLYTTLEITDPKKCQRSFGFGRGVLESERLFCAGTPSTSRVLTDTCTGDSGGGMFCKKPQGTGLDSLWFLYGIVSFGYEGIKDCFSVPNFNYFFFYFLQSVPRGIVCQPYTRMYPISRLGFTIQSIR